MAVMWLESEVCDEKVIVNLSSDVKTRRHTVGVVHLKSLLHVTPSAKALQYYGPAVHLSHKVAHTADVIRDMRVMYGEGLFSPTIKNKADYVLCGQVIRGMHSRIYFVRASLLAMNGDKICARYCGRMRKLAKRFGIDFLVDDPYSPRLRDLAHTMWEQWMKAEKRRVERAAKQAKLAEEKKGGS